MPTAAGLHGHTHVPIAFVEDDGRLGSPPRAGLAGHARRPPRCCSTRAASASRGTASRPRSWMLLETDAGVATWQRTAYDVASVQAAMGAGCPACPARLSHRMGSRTMSR